MKKFDSELEALNRRLEEMARVSKSMLELAVSAIKDPTKDVHAEIEESEAKLDEMQTEIDQAAVRLLAVYGPVAADLRYILVVTHVTAQLERIGDQVVNVFESLHLMQPTSDHAALPELRKMAALVCEMLEDALHAFFRKDADKAETTRAHDDLVDALNAQIVRKLLSDDVLRQVLKGTEDIADALAQILIARHLERIADQAVNVCKEVVYMVRGDDVRHAHKQHIHFT